MSPKIFLAPMAGITDLPFRLICKKQGADKVYSEMISSTGLYYNNRRKSLQLAKSVPEEGPLAVQLFGNNPTHFGYASKVVTNLDKESFEIPYLRTPESIDINFGCPAPKIYRQESGCFLMYRPGDARKIVQEVLANTHLPVSIKIRAGIKNFSALTFLEKIEDLNWHTLIVHARSYEQGFSGAPDYQLIREIKKRFPDKEIIANGGIFTPEDAQKMLEKTLADGLAVARGALGNPWLFSQIKEYLKTGHYTKPSFEEIKKTAQKHAELIKKYKGEGKMMEMRKHLGWYFKDFPSAKKLRIQINSAESFTQIKNLIKKAGDLA
ncbi:MAG: tRNA dihydrouridine synthase [Patescibacteria group bacterium]